MQEVIIDNKQGLVVWNGQQIPRLLLKMIKGAVGKSFVVKHYRDKRGKRKIVVTRFPEMKGVVASDQQRQRRNLFREAVVYAKWIISDEERKQAFRKTLPLKKRRNVYQAALQLYMRMQGDGQWLRKQLAIRSMIQSGRMEVVERNGRWSVANRNAKWGMVRNVTHDSSTVKDGLSVEMVAVKGGWGSVKRGGMVNGSVDLRFAGVEPGNEMQVQRFMWWCKKEMADEIQVDEIPYEVVDMDVGEGAFNSVTEIVMDIFNIWQRTV